MSMQSNIRRIDSADCIADMIENEEKEDRIKKVPL